MPDMQPYLDASSEELQERLRERYTIDTPAPSAYAALNAMDQQYGTPFDPTTGYHDYIGSSERAIAAERARRQYRDLMQRQIRQDLLLDVGRGAAGILGGALLSGVPVVGSIAGFMGGSAVFDLVAEAAGWSDPLQAFSRDDYIRSQMANAIDASSSLALTPFQFGGRGLSIEQSQRVASRLFTTMQGQGFAGLEIERMLPGLSESGLLTPKGTFDSTEQALNAFSENLERLSLRIGDAARRAGMNIEEATAFVVKEQQLAGGPLARGDTRLFGAMDLVSQATGMSYDDSLNMMAGSMGPWQNMTGDLIPFMQATAVTVGAGQAAYQSSPWASAWDRAGGVGAVASGYAAAGNRYWMQNRQLDRLARMHGAGSLTNEAMYDLAAGEDFPELAGFSNANARYESMYYGMEALANDPLAAQAAAFGDTIRKMEDAGVHSRQARIAWLVRNQGYSPSQAAAILDQHQAIATPEGRFAGYLGGQRVEYSRQAANVDSSIDMAFSDMSYLSGETSNYWSSHIQSLYGSPSGVVSAEDRLGYVQEQMATDATLFGRENGTTSNFFGRRGATSIMAPGERSNLGLLGTTLAAQLSARGLNGEGIARGAIVAGIAGMDFSDAVGLRTNVRGGRDQYVVDAIAGVMRSRGVGNAAQQGLGWYMGVTRQVENVIGWDQGTKMLGGLSTTFGVAMDPNEPFWEAFTKLSNEEQLAVMSEANIDINTLYTNGDITGFRGGLEEYMGSPEIMAMVTRGFTPTSAAAMGTLYGAGELGAASRAAAIAIAGSGQASDFYGHLDVGKGVVSLSERRAGLDAQVRALAVLEGLEAAPQNLRFQEGTAGAYQTLNRALADKSYTMTNATTGLNHRSIEDHYTVRDNIAQNGYGKSWEELDSMQRQVVNEWITTNDTPAYSGGTPRWGGQQSRMLDRAREAVGQTSEDLVGDYLTSKEHLGVIAHAEELISTRYTGLSMTDVSAYNTAEVARQTNNMDEYNRIMANFDPAKRAELERFNVEMGTITGMGSAEMFGTLSSGVWLSAVTQIGTATGKSGDDLAAIYNAITTGDTTGIRGMGLTGAWADYARTGSATDLEKAFAESNIELAGQDPVEHIEQNRNLQSVADSLSMGITPVRVIAGGDPLPVTFVGGIRGLLGLGGDGATADTPASGSGGGGNGDV